MERLPAVSKCYEKWMMLQGKVDSYYHDKPQERIPLSQQKEFRQIKNAVIQEAERLRLGEISFEEKGLNRQDEPEKYRNASYDYWTLRDVIRDESLTIDRQVRELKQAGAESIFLEYEHGDAAVKCQLSSLLEQAEEGDTMVFNPPSSSPEKRHGRSPRRSKPLRARKPKQP